MAGFGETLSKFGKSIVDGTKNTAKTVNLSVEIEELESRIKKMYMELGEMYFEKCGSDPDENFAALCRDIKALKDDVENKKTEKITLAGKKICPACSAPVDASSQFCSACGAKFDISNEEAVPADKFCRNCGKKLSASAVFCPDCGSKV